MAGFFLVDLYSFWQYNIHMNKYLNHLQWAGVVCILLGHSLNALGNADPYNIIAFLLGMVFFVTWAILVKNTAQIVVNVVSMLISCFGLYRAFFG
jgi:hypothetical protein